VLKTHQEMMMMMMMMLFLLTKGGLVVLFQAIISINISNSPQITEHHKILLLLHRNKELALTQVLVKSMSIHGLIVETPVPQILGIVEMW
jgi:hypothetical protein